MVISSVPNPKITAMKDRLTPVANADQTESKDARMFKQYSEKTAKVILKYVIQHPDSSNMEIAEMLNISYPCVATVTGAFADVGCLQEHKIGRRKTFKFVKLPNTWDKEDVLAATIDKKREGKPKKVAEKESKSDGTPKYQLATNILESDKIVPFESVESYQRLLKDTTKYYGVKELDDLVGELHRFLQARVSSAVLRCPVCNTVISTDKSAVFCSSCQMSIDLGTSEKSVKALLKYGKALKGVA